MSSISPASPLSPKVPDLKGVKEAIPDLKKLNATINIEENDKEISASFIWHNHFIKISATFDHFPENNFKAIALLNKIINSEFFEGLSKNLSKTPSKSWDFSLENIKAKIHVDIKDYGKPQQIGKLPGFKAILDSLKIKSMISEAALDKIFFEHKALFDDFHNFLKWNQADENLDPYPEIAKLFQDLSDLESLPDSEKIKKSGMIEIEFQKFWEKYKDILNYSATTQKEVDAFLNEKDPLKKTSHIIAALTDLKTTLAKNVSDKIPQYITWLDYRIQQNTGTIIKQEPVATKEAKTSLVQEKKEI